MLIYATCEARLCHDLADHVGDLEPTWTFSSQLQDGHFKVRCQSKRALASVINSGLTSVAFTRPGSSSNKSSTRDWQSWLLLDTKWSAYQKRLIQCCRTRLSCRQRLCLCKQHWAAF